MPSDFTLLLVNLTTSMASFEEKLISAVFLRPFIYDKSSAGHMKKGLLGKAWDEISKESGRSSKLCYSIIKLT